MILTRRSIITISDSYGERQRYRTVIEHRPIHEHCYLETLSVEDQKNWDSVSADRKTKILCSGRRQDQDPQL
jgi:hypothetical protein